MTIVKVIKSIETEIVNDFTKKQIDKEIRPFLGIAQDNRKIIDFYQKVESYLQTKEMGFSIEDGENHVVVFSTFERWVEKELEKVPVTKTRLISYWCDDDGNVMEEEWYTDYESRHIVPDSLTSMISSKREEIEKLKKIAEDEMREARVLAEEALWDLLEKPAREAVWVAKTREFKEKNITLEFIENVTGLKGRLEILQFRSGTPLFYGFIPEGDFDHEKVSKIVERAVRNYQPVQQPEPKPKSVFDSPFAKLKLLK